MHGVKTWRSLLVIILTFMCAPGFASINVNPEFNSKITRLIHERLPDASVGVYVQDALTGETIYDYDGSKHFLPASTTKLFTAAAALKLLGPDYRFETSLYYLPSSIQYGVYNGDVVLKFSGDPSLQLTSLYSLLQTLADAQIKTIKGNFLIDDHIFNGPEYALGWTWDSTPWHHAAPVTAIIIDRNQFGVTLIPSPNVGAQVMAKLDQEYPASKFRTLSADIRAVTYEDSETLCQLIAQVDDKNNLQLGGCWPIGSQPVHLRFAVKNPSLQASQLINEALQKLDIQLMGKITRGSLPNNMIKMAHHSSEPLTALLRPILAESNNLYAESLIKTLGARVHGAGSFKTGSSAVQKVLSSVGLDFNDARLVDGSGESRYNLLTPRHLARLLLAMQHEMQLTPHFRNALAMSGMNGSLQNRFGKNMLPVWAKTGSLYGVSTLAGYFSTKQKNELIIAIMINQAMENNAMLKQFEEELCYLFMEQL